VYLRKAQSGASVRMPRLEIQERLLALSSPVINPS
jgi:predicted DNA-binding protein